MTINGKFANGTIGRTPNGVNVVIINIRVNDYHIWKAEKMP